jgi:hypothetical protein
MSSTNIRPRSCSMVFARSGKPRKCMPAFAG